MSLVLLVIEARFPLVVPAAISGKLVLLRIVQVNLYIVSAFCIQNL